MFLLPLLPLLGILQTASANDGGSINVPTMAELWTSEESTMTASTTTAAANFSDYSTSPFHATSYCGPKAHLASYEMQKFMVNWVKPLHGNAAR